MSWLSGACQTFRSLWKRAVMSGMLGGQSWETDVERAAARQRCQRASGWRGQRYRCREYQYGSPIWQKRARGLLECVSSQIMCSFRKRARHKSCLNSIPAIVLLPTPPLADDTATTASTPAIRRRCGGRGQLAGVPVRGRPSGFSCPSARLMHKS